ncbi:hypothetical protein AVEN_188936-1 [Araneus ventricosus]|uniref:Uncharacterized protein n=1 Tax=Araneus ventricosus TaxID=182803 RepID=A0A4Y2D8T6_ARAVE|nr:hypothetical protein AVEN_251237-1 [Araneus ventricosus]GBM13238.1 hypothetical protein AVEN_59042-1 [Araneus ventricosus]GBM13257.1 hypothetical protein AVEN_109459-1 [Araneus ventricosus]GBM13287.1 hypothetical protein AVEN_188936-1 [Araneus ventricosus]
MGIRSCRISKRTFGFPVPTNCAVEGVGKLHNGGVALIGPSLMTAHILRNLKLFKPNLMYLRPENVLQRLYPCNGRVITCTVWNGGLLYVRPQSPC